MNKRIIALLIAILFISTGSAYGVATKALRTSNAAQVPAHENVIYEGAVGSSMTVPVQVVRKVRFSYCPTAANWNNSARNWILSGEAVVWDINSADGVSVTKAETLRGKDGANVGDDTDWVDLAPQISNDLIAGIAVTDIMTSDSTTLDPYDKSWGYICVRGYCLVSVDQAVPAGANLGLSALHLGAMAPVSSDSAIPGNLWNQIVSSDINCLVEEDTGSVKVPVMIN